MGGPAHRTWRAFTVRARSEKRVADRLSAAGIETFLPLRRALRQWSDRKKWVEVPLFSGYVFARVDERERLVVLETEAVVK
ncbi:MAG: transcription termination/antitermination NusG family protein, partial [Bacteroidota bacterium]